MNRTPRVSVVMAVRKERDDLFQRSILSVLGQTERDIELVCVDDGMSEVNLAFLGSLGDERVRVIGDASGRGLTKSLNIGVAAARGEVIVRQDSDDWSEPERIALQIEYLDRHPDVVVLATRFVNEFENGVRAEKLGFVRTDEVAAALCLGNPFGHSTLAFRRVIRGMPVFYDESFVRAQDYELIVRLSKLGEVAVLPCDLVHRHVGPGAISSLYRKEQMRFALKARRRALNFYGWSLQRSLSYARTWIGAMLPDVLYRRLKAGGF